MQTQQGDVLLFQTLDDGNIEIVDGVTTMTGRFDTMAYLCLFGGNEDDDGSANNTHNWWGNLWETDVDRQYRSQTQHLLQALPATSNNLKRVKAAALQDLRVFTNKNIASSVDVETSIPALNTIRLQIVIEADGQRYEFEYTENWEAAA